MTEKNDNLRILFIGDVVAKIGRRAVQAIVPNLRSELDVHMVIANAENAAHGAGLTQKTYDEIISSGVDFLTSGNHIWNNPDALNLLTNSAKIIRPANYPEGTEGCGWKVVEVSKKNVLVINLMGRVFMHDYIDCPFRTLDSILLETKAANLHAIVIDFHAEATSEKVAFGWYAANRVSAVLGTHTHIMTADERILPHGTAYISDVGMTGHRDSVLGVQKEAIIKKFLTQLPVRHEYEETGPAIFRAVLVEIDSKNCKAVSIKRIERELVI